MSVLFWGLTIGAMGKIFLAIGVLKVHHIMAKEHRINNKVIHSFAVEKTLTITGIVFIIVGYLMELYFYGLTPLLTCQGSECMQAAAVLFSQ